MVSVFIPPIGHAGVQAQMAALLAQGVLPHALLLHGPRGVGKATLAQWLAARLICGAAAQEKGTLQPDTSSPQWAQLQAGSCPDFHVLAPEEGKRSIGVKAVQQLMETLLRSSDHARVAVVDAVEDLTTEAANTLLKTLEEPRPGIYFLLVSHQLARVLPTIRSRCRMLKLGVLQETEAAEVLAAQGADRTAAAAAKGAPGAWLALTSAQREAWQSLQRGELPDAKTPGLIPLLQQRLASLSPSLARAELYQALAQAQSRQSELNLPLALVQSQALALAAPHLQEEA